MPNATATQVKKSNNPFDIFITGLRKGFNVAINNLMPNVLMAFVLAYILDLFGVMSFLGKVCGPVMSIFDLPGHRIQENVFQIQNVFPLFLAFQLSSQSS